MRPVARTMLAFAVGRAVFGLLFLVSMLGHWRMPWYLPLEHRWVIASSVDTVGMDWYGRSAFALAAGLVSGLAAWALGGWTRTRAWLGRPAVVLNVSHLGATMLLFDVIFYTLTLLTRTIDATPPPSWYCPR
jgi:hypothetical protein